MLWVADITYIPTWAGFLYLAVVLDAFSRRIVGWSMATTLHTQVVLDALDMAAAAAERRDPPFGSRLAVYLDRVRQTMVFAPRWGRSETPTIMRWRRVSSPRSNVSCSIGAHSRRGPRRALPSSNSSRASTIRGGGTHRLGISPRSTTSAATTRERLIPAHTIVPPCSGPSRCGLETAEDVSTPTQRPTLTAPARTGVRDARAGTEKRTPQGPNRKTAVNRRTRCRHPSLHPSTKPGQVQPIHIWPSR